MSKSPIQQRNAKLLQKTAQEKPSVSKRLNCVTSSPIFASGLNVKANDDIVVINFLDSINNEKSSCLITSIAIPHNILIDLHESLEKILKEREKNKEKE